MEPSQIRYRLQRMPLDQLMREADAVRAEAKGEGVFLRALVEFSNYCMRNCLYCGLRKANNKIDRHRLCAERIVEAAQSAAGMGVGTIVLQSGDDLEYPARRLAEIIKRIKEHADIKVTLSVGERPWTDYELWREAGADRYLMKHETSNPILYRRFHPGKTLEERLSALRFLKQTGYEIGTGFIVGLPGQHWSTLVDDVLLAAELGAGMCGVGPFLPQADTPLASKPTGSAERTLRIIALLRLVCPDINLPATTALASLDPQKGQILALKAGANVIMPSFTPESIHRNYSIYDNKTKVSLDNALDAIQCAGRVVIKDGSLHAHGSGCVNGGNK